MFTGYKSRTRKKSSTLRYSVHNKEMRECFLLIEGFSQHMAYDLGFAFAILPRKFTLFSGHQRRKERQSPFEFRSQYKM